MRHYCTYFDSRFLARALALLRSLERHERRPFTLHALCLDDAAHRAVMRLALPHLQPISLRQLEDAYPRLRAARGNRSLVEYYFTCTPALPLYLLERYPQAECVTYLDADLFFFSSPEAIFDEFASASVAIIEHRYPPHLHHLRTHGTYNVGLLIFRNDEHGKGCLRWWHEQCLAWCGDEPQADGRYADQGYLNDWCDRFPGVKVLQHRGVNAAPWNLAGHGVSLQGSGSNFRVMIDDDPLVVYHFHRLKMVRPYLFDSGLDHYGVEASATITRHIYGPYLAELTPSRQPAGQAHPGNLRLTQPQTSREILRLALYGRPMLVFGPVVSELHLEPYARPLLWLRERWRWGRNHRPELQRAA